MAFVFSIQPKIKAAVFDTEQLFAKNLFKVL